MVLPDLKLCCSDIPTPSSGLVLVKDDLLGRVRQAAAEIGIPTINFDDDRRHQPNNWDTTMIVKDALLFEEIGYIIAFARDSRGYFKNIRGDYFTTKSFLINPDPLVFSNGRVRAFRQALEEKGLEPGSYRPSRTRFYSDREVEISVALSEGRIQPKYP